jgi:hydroxypyruvate reductase
MEAVSKARGSFAEAFRVCLTAVDPGAGVSATLESFDLADPIRLVAIGKAASGMARGALAVLDGRVEGGIVVSPELSPTAGESLLHHLPGGHPLPTAASFEAGAAAMTEAARARGTLLVLISGGASALAEVPRDGLSLDDLATTYRLLLRAGQPIERMNTVRRHLSALKNGGLLRVAGAPTVTLLIADVAGGDPSAIGSGPTLTDGSTASDALMIAAEAGILEALPPAVLRALRSPARRPPSRRPHRWAVVTDGLAALRAAASHLERSGYVTEVDPTPLTGDAAAQGRFMAMASAASAVMLRHGETVVKVRGERPGGRNQHAALAAALALEGQAGVFGAFATDGRDGSTGAAGGIVDGETCHRLRTAGLDPEQLLAECRSHEALAASGDEVVTGPTGTNVADIWMVWRQGG